jgi:transposase
MENSIIETIGCDLGDKTSVVHVLSHDGAATRCKVKTTPSGIQQFFRRPRAHVVLEVGAHSRWVSELLKELGHKVTVANSRRLKLISQGNSKSDEQDAELLARLGRADAGLLAPVTHRGRAAQADLAVTKTRDVLVRSRSRWINHVRGVVKSFGVRLPRCNPECFPEKTRVLVPQELELALQPCFAMVEQVNDQIRAIDQALEKQIAPKYPDVEVIHQPAGVGVLTALVFLLTLEDKERFKKSRTAGAFVGLRPRKAQSGDHDPQLRITKAGDPFLRRLLVSSANYILGPFAPDSDLRRWGLRLAERGGKNGRKRAKVAVARKLAVLLHRLWVTGEVYQPLGYTHRNVA